MAIRARMWGAGKILVLIGALFVTFLVSAATSMRMALRAREIKVPDFSNRTANDATALAANLGLAIKVDDARRIDPKVPAGHVLTQDPAPGTTTRMQRSVRIWLSAGTRAPRVPQLVGQTERTAQLRLTQDGFDAGTVSEIRAEGLASDVVVAQDPPASTGGAHVALLVNRAEQAFYYVMPDLIGVNGDRAATILRAHGVRVAVVAAVPYPGVPQGIVLRQHPQAGFQIAPGEAISIEVSR